MRKFLFRAFLCSFLTMYSAGCSSLVLEKAENGRIKTVLSVALERNTERLPAHVKVISEKSWGDLKGSGKNASVVRPSTAKAEVKWPAGECRQVFGNGNEEKSFFSRTAYKPSGYCMENRDLRKARVSVDAPAQERKHMGHEKQSKSLEDTIRKGLKTGIRLFLWYPG